jgi:hypothetical protein
VEVEYADLLGIELVTLSSPAPASPAMREKQPRTEAPDSVSGMADYLPLLGELASLQPPMFIFGGIAEEVLLDGELSSSHGDVDVLTRREQLKLQTEQLAELGFRDFAVHYEPIPRRPLVLGSSRGDLVLELNLLDYDEMGDPYFVVRIEDGPVAISLPSDLLSWPPTIIDGVPIRTLSPLALVQIRAGLTATGVFGPPRPGKDGARQTRLIQAFFPDRDEEPLEPRIAAIADQ